MKIVLSLYGDETPGKLDPEMAQKIAGEGVKDANLAILNDPTYENLLRYVLTYADGVAIGSAQVSEAMLEIVRQSGKPVLEYQAREEADFFDNYNRFYEQL